MLSVVVAIFCPEKPRARRLSNNCSLKLLVTLNWSLVPLVFLLKMSKRKALAVQMIYNYYHFQLDVFTVVTVCHISIVHIATLKTLFVLFAFL